MPSFRSISLRNGDRAIAGGGTQSGKSTLCAGSTDYPFADTLCGQYLAMYPDSQLLIADSKPRFRAAYNAEGLDDRRHYRQWDYGPPIPGSTRVAPGDRTGLYRALNTSRIVIVQTDAIDRDAGAVTYLIDEFRRSITRKHKRMVFVDEVMDFYTQSGMPLRGTNNVILRCLRAGAERSLTTLLAGQRVKGIPPQFWELINRLYLFRMDKDTDMERVEESGAPVHYRENMARMRRGEPPVKGTLWPPEEDHIFRYWTKLDRRKVYGPYQLAMKGR